jgi:thymidylate kinase
MGNHSASKIVNHGDQVIHASTRIPEPTRSREDFLSCLFSALDSNQVRYCVLHSWEELPEKLSGDLDIAVHPGDKRKLALVFGLLRDQNYTLVQAINYFAGARCFVFLWFERAVINSVAVDVIFEHQRGALIVPSIEELVSGRRRHGPFWIPVPQAEFVYLLAKKAWKGMAAPTTRVRRLRMLVQQLGRPTAERLAGQLFRRKLDIRVVEACAGGRVNGVLAQIKTQAWKTSLVRNPLRLIADLFSDAMRCIRRWQQLTGLFVVVLGPDGAGKSTLIGNVVQAVGPAFGRYRVFHWRPMLLWRRKTTGDTTQPHSRPPHLSWWSSARLVAHLLDYWFGYWLVIRPLLARAGLVFFDRYFDDVLIDPKRYRYGGPLWFARILRPLIPQPDLILVLDATEEAVLSRKQELAPEEVRRQRRLYANCMNGISGTRVIDATGPASRVTAEAGSAIVEYLSQRFERQHAGWFSNNRIQGETGPTCQPRPG